jgi:hypothetical protein
VRFIARLPHDETAPENSDAQDYGADYDGEDEDGDEDEEATVAPDTTKLCGWKNCDKMFTGSNAPTLLHVRPTSTSMRVFLLTLTTAQLHITKEHITKAGDTKNYDPKCHWAGCPYTGKIRGYLLSHILTHVPEYRPLDCDECDSTFQRESDLRGHHKRCHQEEK